MPPIPPYEYPTPPPARSSPGDEQPKPDALVCSRCGRQVDELTSQGICFPCFTGDRLKDFFYGDKRKPEPYQPVTPGPGSRKPNMVQPFQRPPARPFIEDRPETPVAHVVPEQPEKQPNVVMMSHPETVTLPPTQEVQQYEPEVERKPAPTSTAGSKPEEKSSIRKNNLPKPEEKASKPEAPTSTAGSKNKKGRKFNGGGGRIHTEAHIDQILDEYLISGKLPSYVSDRQRYDYRHHIRLPERRQLLDKQQAAGNQASGPHTATGPKDNITRFPGTGTHDS